MISALSAFLYERLLIFLLPASGIYFTLRGKFMPFRLLPEAFRAVGEKADDSKGASAFGTLMISTASRVGTGNIVGVSTALCMGGCGALFWLWVTAFIGSANAFAEATLAQLYKRRSKSGFYGGPSYYIEAALHSKAPAAVFALLLIAAYGIGFNMLSAYNLQSAFSGFAFYDAQRTPRLVGVVLALLCLTCLLGENRRLLKINELIVPVMGLLYAAAAFYAAVRNISLLPGIFAEVFRSAFDSKAILGGLNGSCLMVGLRRGLFSGEGGIGSSPNAAASAHTCHPVRQGLVQMLSVGIDALLCTATALLCLCSGIVPSPELSGMPYIRLSFCSIFGSAGQVFSAAAMVLFAFTTLLGDFYYIDSSLRYLLGAEPPEKLLGAVRMVGCFFIFLGCSLASDKLWELADVLMGLMCVINLPVLLCSGGKIVKCLDDYLSQKRRGGPIRFSADDVGIHDTVCWK